MKCWAGTKWKGHEQDPNCRRFCKDQIGKILSAQNSARTISSTTQISPRTHFAMSSHLGFSFTLTFSKFPKALLVRGSHAWIYLKSEQEWVAGERSLSQAISGWDDWNVYYNDINAVSCWYCEWQWQGVRNNFQPCVLACLQPPYTSSFIVGHFNDSSRFAHSRPVGQFITFEWCICINQLYFSKSMNSLNENRSKMASKIIIVFPVRALWVQRWIHSRVLRQRAEQYRPFNGDASKNRRDKVSLPVGRSCCMIEL